MTGFFSYVSRSSFDDSVFIGHVMHQRGNANFISQRFALPCKSYKEAKEIAELICDYLNGVV